jgi:hypothetical protein
LVIGKKWHDSRQLFCETVAGGYNPDMNARTILNRVKGFLAAMLVLPATPVFAQRTTLVEDEVNVIWHWLILVVLCGLIVSAVFKNPKRSHLD